MDVDWRKEVNAPEPGTVLCEFAELESGKIREFRFGENDPFRMIVYRKDDQVFAYVNQCPHHWLAMNRQAGKFIFWDEDEIMCVHHSAVFKLATGGFCSMGPCQGSNLTVVPLVVTDGSVAIGDSLGKWAETSHR